MGLSKDTLDDLRIDRDGPRPAPNRGWLVWTVLILAIVIGGGVWWSHRAQPVEVHTAVAREVSSRSGSQRTVLNASGYVTARRAATVSSKVTGKVTEVLVEEGKRVQAGQILARLDDTNIQTTLRLAEAQLAAAKSSLDETRVRLKEADLQHQRTIELLKSQVATKAELEHAEADAHSLKARLERQQADITVAERQIAVWQQDADDSIIRAPFAGIVTSKNAQPGEMISPMSAGGSFTRTGICTIVDMNSLEIEIDVNESYINRVEPGQAVEAKLDAYPDWTIPCKVIAIIPTADRQKATVKVRVSFDQLDPRILPDMAAKVAFHSAETSASTSTATRTVTVPRAAMQTADGHDTVWVVENLHARRRPVTVSNTRDDEAVISAGITGGETVVLDAPRDLSDGALIKESKP